MCFLKKRSVRRITSRFTGLTSGHRHHQHDPSQIHLMLIYDIRVDDGMQLGFCHNLLAFVHHNPNYIIMTHLMCLEDISDDVYDDDVRCRKHIQLNIDRHTSTTILCLVILGIIFLLLSPIHPKG